MGDIDILIQKNHINEVTQTLLLLGYKQEGSTPDEFYLTHQHLKPFHHSGKDSWVEVHTSLFAKNNQFGKRNIFKVENIFDNLARIKSCSNNVYSLNAELNLQYTITHWIKEFKIANSLIQLVDIIKLIEESNIDWAKFSDDIKTRNHATEVKITLNLLIKNNLIQLPNKIQRNIFNKKDSTGIIGKWLMHRIMNGYLHQNVLITRIIGHTNCSRLWDVYLRDAHCITNHFHALSAIFFADVPGSKSKLHSLLTRLKRFYLRYIRH